MPQVSHTILSWARNSAGLSIDDAANKLQIKDSGTATAAEKLLAYEQGEKTPSRALLIRIAKAYQRPLLTFYLKEPPERASRGEDFRTLPDEIEARENAYVDALIRDIKVRQSTLKEALIDEDEADPITFIGSMSMDDGVNAIEERIRGVLDFDNHEYRNQYDAESAFKYLRRKIEETGVYVILKGNLGSHHTNIPVQLFRGLALSDNVAPFIVINDKDAKTAWSFTLIHEMTHLVLGQTGVSGLVAEKSIEKFCNEVASELFLPSEDMHNFVLGNDNFEGMCLEISNFAETLNVSSSHVAYRLYLRGDIPFATWKRLSSFYHDKWKARKQKERVKNSKSKGGPDYYVMKRHSLGGALLNVVDRFLQSGTLSTTRAAKLLDVKPIKVHKVFE